MCITSELVLPMVFENQALSRTSDHQQQNRDRSRFFYKLRQKRKQRRLQHGQIRRDSHYQHHAQEIERTDQKQQKEPRLITAIVGSSIARNIVVHNIESRTNEVRLRFQSGSDCAEALGWLQSTDGQFFMRGVHHLIFIIGTNDLHRVGAFETVQRIDYTIATVRCLYPKVSIVWQLLQQRTRKTWLLSEGQSVLNEIERCNVFLLDLATKRNFETIQPKIPIEYMYDGLHPSKCGVEMMEATIRNHLQKYKTVHSFLYSTDPCCFRNDVYLPPLMSIKF
ncbi:unnamed protein product [Adineta ricciae]|uniref:SGNH hydrolase-type esterase domain-containing protein n=1 Tax=Adineta ricciae TaxID=249248 RepID=A0A815TJD9_ADIRI|nr:unnamed protein product [Adineta ricciae]CAF1599794.1 unnamed protein product [Adineta ricciae]